MTVQNNSNSVAKNLITGGFAGATGIAAALPGLNVKVLFQAIKGNMTRAQKMQTVFSEMRSNPRILVNGFTPMTTSTFPGTAQSYAVFNIAKFYLSKGGKKELSMKETLAISGVAGFLSLSCITPSEVLLVRMGQHKKGVVETFKTTVAAHGWKGLYRGAFFTGNREAVFTIADQIFAEKNPFLAAIAGALISHPADTWKTIMQRDFAFKLTLQELLKTNPYAGLIPRLIGLMFYMNVAPRVRKAIES